MQFSGDFKKAKIFLRWRGIIQTTPLPKQTKAILVISLFLFCPTSLKISFILLLLGNILPLQPLKAVTIFSSIGEKEKQRVRSRHSRSCSQFLQVRMNRQKNKYNCLPIHF